MINYYNGSWFGSKFGVPFLVVDYGIAFEEPPTLSDENEVEEERGIGVNRHCLPLPQVWV